MRSAPRLPEERELMVSDLTALGYRSDMARRILALLNEEDLLDHYLTRGARQDCIPITRVSREYPVILRQRLGLDSPGCLWAKGDVSFLNTPAIALVGSRDLREDNRKFAEAVGYEAAIQGLTLVSGNARGADKTAQEACLNAGGRVISIVADSLASHKERHNLLYVSEEDYGAEFSAQRALSRNRSIHALGRMVFVAQCGFQTGGTWDGTVKNLRFGWSEVACFRDGSEASILLEQMGAYLIGMDDLSDFGGLPESDLNFLV
jgi:predicted Rossmann fold nucleotide-binding protein DprA/Smf involved in DNA uptake